MYQSVGHEMIDLFAEAMELPLYRAEIRGDAKTTEKDYPAAKEGDEVEDLYHLLRQIQVGWLNLLVVRRTVFLLRRSIRSMPCRLAQSSPSTRIIELLMCKSISFDRRTHRVKKTLFHLDAND